VSVSDLLRTCRRRVSIVTASTIGLCGLAHVATATAGSMASRGLEMWGPLDRASEVAKKVAQRSASHDTATIRDCASARPVVGVASGGSAVNVSSARNCAADPETEAMKGVRPRTASNVISDKLVNKIVGVESGGRNDAKNLNSSALGQGQFIRSTWLGLVRKYKPDWAEGLTGAQILEKRKDAEASRWAIKAYAEENAPKLERAGVGVDEASLYLAHMFDGPVAVKLYKARPDTAVKNVVGAAAVKSNRKLLVGKKVKHLIAWAQAKMGGEEVASNKPLRQKQIRVRTDT